MLHWLTALALCVAAAAFEGLCAGKNPLGELRKLRQPWWSPPIGAWVMIGIAWYAICFIALVRLLPIFAEEPTPTLLIVALMLGNGAVNLFQFRMRRLDLALASFAPYWVLLGGFLVTVCPVDSLSFWLFAAYAIYQLYAAAWGFALWRLNRPAAS